MLNILYSATNKINNKVYIGITTKSLKYRIKRHKSAAKSIDTKFYRAIKKYGFETFKWEELAYCQTWEDAQFLEIMNIKFYDSYNNGYNSTFGGDGLSFWTGKTHSIESREKMSLAKKGKKSNRKNFKHSEETKKYLSEIGKGKAPSNKGKHWTDEQRKNTKNNREIIAIDLYSGFIFHFYSIITASKELNVCRSSIMNTLSNKYKNRKYSFIYADSMNIKEH